MQAGKELGTGGEYGNFAGLAEFGGQASDVTGYANSGIADECSVQNYPHCANCAFARWVVNLEEQPVLSG